MSPDLSILSEGIGLAAVMLVAMLIVYVLSFGISIACYILQSLGLYNIAQRRGLKHPWMAWVPVTNMWILGSISDQYQYVSQGLVRNRRKILVGLGVAAIVLGMVFFGVYAGMLVNLLLQIPELETMTDNQIMKLLVPSLAGLGGVSVVLWIVGVLSMIFQYICLYNLYASCRPDNKVAFLVLSIIFSITTAFFVFACRKKDLGMPPRRDASQSAPVLPPQVDTAE